MRMSIILRTLKHAFGLQRLVYLRLCWVFPAVRGLPPAAASAGWRLAEHGLLTRWLLSRSAGAGHRASVAAVPLSSAVRQQGGQTRVP